MNFGEKVKITYENNKKSVWTGLAVLIMIGIVIILALTVQGIKKKDTEEVQTYTYENKAEQRLAQNVEDYVGQFALLENGEEEEVAYMAVQTYNAILSSGVNKVTSEHTTAIESLIQKELQNLISSDKVPNEEMEALTSGVSQIIWDTVLSQLEESELVHKPEYEEQYLELYNSVRQQVDELDKKVSNLKITANIKVNSKEDIENTKTEIYENLGNEISDTKTEILSAVDEDMADMKEEIISEIKDEYGNITSGKDGENGKDGTAGKDGVDGKDGENGKDGADGKDGENGKDGIDGKDGVDGEDGEDGKTTYMAYAEDDLGTGFSLVPTDTTKYIGTCITNAETAPTDPAEYKNWQQYRDYIMTTTVDENGVPTLHIR